MLQNILLLIPQASSVVPKVDIGESQSTYAVANWIMSLVYHILDFFGLERNHDLFIVIYALLVFGIAFAVGWLVQWITLGIVNLVGRKLKGDLYTSLRKHKFFTKITRIIPAIIFLILIQFTLYGHGKLGIWLTRITWIYVLFIVVIAINTFVDVLWVHFDNRDNTRKLPLKGLVQLAKGIVWIIMVIIAVAIIVDKSPTTLLAGLGAFAAVLMLVFKDSILGVVAGVQLSENDSLHVGDWIKVHGTDANGTVIEVSLTAVKIRNWDKTVTTVPPYSLISGSFTNYLPMQQSKTRRVERSYMIDSDSVVPADDAMLEAFAKIPLLGDWIAQKIADRKAGKENNVNNPAGIADGSIDTNLGIFRAYLKIYLDHHPHVSHEQGDLCFISTLAQTPTGIPLQLYFFTNTSVWAQYEAIQSSVFEHVAVMLYRFGLYTFENPSGRDTIIDGWMSPGKNPDVVFGMPYPFFQGAGSPENPASPIPHSAYPEPSAMAPSNVPKELDVHKVDSDEDEKESEENPATAPVPPGN